MTLNIVAWHDRTQANHLENLNRFAADGYRTLSLSVYGERSDPRYAAVMIKRPAVHASRQFVGMNQGEWQQRFNEMAAAGFGPYIVTATGPANDPLIAAAFKPMNGVPLTRHGITSDELGQVNDQAQRQGAILGWADAYGSPADTRYIAVWFPNTDQAAWNCDARDEDLATLQQRFNALTSTGARPAHVAVTPSNRCLELFVDTKIGPWASRVNLTSEGYQNEFNTMTANGLVPVCVSANGSGSQTRFAAIFASREERDPRTFRAAGPSTVPEIDQVMESYLRGHRLRGAALAIIRGTRLVYAKGYTFAEADYPTVQPVTPFRQASVSKMLAALATYRLMQTNPNVTLNTTMQSVLKLTTPDGGQPVDGFDKITIRHLLESTSGLDNGAIWQDVPAVQAAKTPLPAIPIELQRYIATLKLTGTPGDPHNVQYGNTSYFMLSQVLAKLTNSSSFEQALATLLQPLGLQHTRGSRSLANVQMSDEARYHLSVYGPPLFPLVVGNSLRTNDRPLVAQQYGCWSLENFDGTGGISSSIVDVARAAASLSVRSNNPLLSTASLDAILTNAAKATSTLTGPDKHGFHGFDWVVATDAGNHVFQGTKGGWLPGHQTGVEFTTGGMSYVIAINGNERSGVTARWDAVKAIASNRNWGSTDLFPQFGMPAFPSPAAPAFITVPPEVVEAQGVPTDVFATSMQMEQESVHRVNRELNVF